MLEETATWPAPASSIGAARALLAEVAGKRVIIAPDRDADGLAAGALVVRAVERLGGEPIVVLPGKGEHVHSPSMRARLETIRADLLVVLDMGSRAGPIVDGLPTIVLDHHDARETPDSAVFVSAAGCEPVVPTGLLAYLVLSPIVDIADLEWLAHLAVVGDLGDQHSFPIKHKTHLKNAVALINSARRSAGYEPQVALDAVLGAKGPAEIARSERLAALRAEVNAEVARFSRVAPKVAGEVALIRFTSRAQIHPLIATRWTQRLAPRIVLVANDGYIPGRVNFVVRCARAVDLLAWLRALPLGEVEGEFANGHPRATGGSIPPRDFERMLEVLGFTPVGAEVHRTAPAARRPPPSR